MKITTISKKVEENMVEVLKAQFIGSNMAKFNDIVVKGHSPVCKLSKKLKELGYEDSSIEFYRGTTKCIIVKSFYKQADMGIKEGPLRYEDLTNPL